MTMDWYCEAYRCWMTKTVCDSRRKLAITGKYRQRSIYANAGCGTCLQKNSKPRTVEPEPAAQIQIIQEANVEQTPSIQQKNNKTTLEIPKEKRCTRCKQVKKLDQFSGAAKGRYGKKATCKTCDTARYLEAKTCSKQVATEPRTDNPAITEGHPAPAKPGKECIFIDMTEYPEIHQTIMEISRQEFRTPEMQVLFWLKNHLPPQTL